MRGTHAVAYVRSQGLSDRYAGSTDVISKQRTGATVVGTTSFAAREDGRYLRRAVTFRPTWLRGEARILLAMYRTHERPHLERDPMLQLGWKAGTEQYPPAELADYAVAAEKAGFDSIDASDHFHPWSEQGQACFVWSWLGVVAARTGKIALGTGITCPIIRYHPAVIAQAAATIACLAPGRFYLGLGTGEA